MIIGKCHLRKFLCPVTKAWMLADARTVFSIETTNKVAKSSAVSNNRILVSLIKILIFPLRKIRRVLLIQVVFGGIQPFCPQN